MTVTGDPHAPTRVLGDELARLWSDEYCSWRIEHHGQPWSEPSDPFVVVLEWVEEGLNVHHADWVTYTWQFYGANVEEALVEAVNWVARLAPWRPCAECDGKGIWNGVPCADCGTTGLAATDGDSNRGVAGDDNGRTEGAS
jgi:hypothetical protein